MTVNYDRNKHGLPRESRQRGLAGVPDAAPGPPAVWEVSPAITFGQFPRGFIAWFSRLVGVGRQHIGHICSGALPPGEGRVRIDLRAAVFPSVIAAATHLPLRSGSFRCLLIDPPYTARYSRDLYDVRRYPRPSHLLREASRVLAPGGVVGILHFHIPRPRGELILESVYGISTGCGYKIRALTLFRRRSADLALTAPLADRKKAPISGR